MSAKIEIDVKINGKVGKLSDISDETLGKIKKAEIQTPFEHGDYGYCLPHKEDYRLFIENGSDVDAYTRGGLKAQPLVNTCKRVLYVCMGNIFKDMEENN